MSKTVHSAIKENIRSLDSRATDKEFLTKNVERICLTTELGKIAILDLDRIALLLILGIMMEMCMETLEQSLI